MTKVKIVDKTGGLTNILPPKISYSSIDKKMSVDEIITQLLLEQCSRTFNLFQIKEALQRMDTRDFKQEKVTIVFLARHMAGGNHVLIKVTYHVKKEEFTIDDVCYNDSRFPEGILVAYASN